jgi:hypothetical protein
MTAITAGRKALWVDTTTRLYLAGRAVAAIVGCGTGKTPIALASVYVAALDAITGTAGLDLWKASADWSA